MKIVTKRVASILVIAILALSFVTVPAFADVTITDTQDTDGDPKTSGDKGDKVVVKGSGVQGGRVVNLYWDLVQDWSASDGAGLLNSSKAKSSGAFEVWFRVPEADNGTHYIYIEDSYTLDWDLVDFAVYPKISLSSSSGLAGDDVDVDGYGFSSSADIAIIINSTNIDNSPGDTDNSVVTGTGSEEEFDGTLNYNPVIPGSVDFYNATGPHILDDGVGGLSGTGVDGSINYVTGEWELEFDTAPSTTTDYDVDYDYVRDVDDEVETLTTSPSTNDFGSFSREIDIPTSFDEGGYNITVMDENGVIQLKKFVIGPVITISPDSGPVGTVVTVDGRGFTQDKYIMTATLNGIDCYLETNKSVTSKEKFTIEFIVPSAGDADEEYEFYVKDGGGKSATADFELTGEAWVKVDPQSAALGDEIEIWGGNFSAIDEELVELTLWDTEDPPAFADNIDVDDTETDSNGEISGIYSVPPVGNAKYTIIAEQPDYNIKAEVDFTVGLIFVVVKPLSGTCGEDVQISGVGFDEDSKWNATFGDIEILPDQAVKSGGLLDEGKFYVPTVDPGTYTIRVIGETTENYLEFDFEVTDKTYIEFDPDVIPVGEDESFNVTVEGEFWLYDNDVLLEPIEMIMYNVSADGDIEDEWDVTAELNNTYSNEDGEFETWFWFYYTEDISPGEYIVNATMVWEDVEFFAQTTITVVPESYSITPRKSSFAISDNVAFNIINSFKLDGAFMEIYDPNGDLYWITDEITSADWVKVGTAHQVPYYAQTSNANSLLLDPDAPIGEWFWIFYKGEEDELVNGTFTVGEAAEDILGRMIEELAGDLTQLSDDFAGISTDVSALATDVQALAGSVSDAIAAANAATSAVQQVASAVADVADVAAAAASAAEQAATAAASAQEAASDAGRSASGLTTLVYGAIGASLIAALAAIVSLMQISRRIAG